MYQKTILDNGLRLLTAAMPHTKAVSMNFFVGAGSRCEDDAHAGISHFIEHLCFRGTPNRPTAREISAAIEGTGGVLNAGTDKEITVYWCKVARPHFPLAFEVMVDMLRNSRFDAGDIEKERQVIIEEINMCNDSPPHRVDMLIDELLWPGHALGRDIAGSKESVTSITRDMLLDYLSEQYRPGNMVLSIAGDIDHAEVLASVKEALGQPANGAETPACLEFNGELGERVLVENRDTEQAHLCLGLPALPIGHPGRFALSLLNIVLGEGMSSRLFTEIRDRMGLAYSIHSSVDHFCDTGALTISAGVDVQKLEVAIKAILEELGGMRELIPAQELNKARDLFKGRLMLRMEDSRSVAGWMGGEELLTGHVLTVEEVIDSVDGITAEQIQRLAAELLTGEQLRLAVVGPYEQNGSLENILKM